MQEAEWNDRFIAYAGRSVGVLNLIGFRNWWADKINSAYIDLVEDTAFINYLRWVMGRGKILDHTYLLMFLNERFSAGGDMFCNDTPPIYAQVTEYETGKGQLLEMNSIDIVRGSTAIPGLCPPTTINDKKFVDGACSPPQFNEFLEIIEREHGPIDNFLFIGNRSMANEAPLWRSSWAWWMTYGLLALKRTPPPTRHGTANIDWETTRAITKMQTFPEERCNFLALYPSYMTVIPQFPSPKNRLLGRRQINRDIVKKAGERGRADFLRLLEIALKEP
jgi:hypothetical protein